MQEQRDTSPTTKRLKVQERYFLHSLLQTTD